jgi:hypothetical protein
LIPLGTELKLIGEKTSDAYDYFKTVVKNYPDFPGKDDINDTISELFNEIKEMNTLLDQLENDVRQMNSSLQADGQNLPEPALEALVKAADTAVKTKDETTKQIKSIEEVLQDSKQEAEWCYLWMSYHDLCNQLQFYNNFLASSLKGIAKNLVTAEVTKGMNPILKKVVGKVIDRLIRTPKTPVGTANKIMGKMAKLRSLVYEKLMKTCTNYTGDAEGEYQAELLHNSMPFFTMIYKISGKMDLTFKKRKPGDPAVYLEGRFKGNVGDIECLVTMAPFARPDTIGPVWCLGATPLVADRSFLLYIEGKAADDRMELKLKKVGRDFKLKARAFYVMLSSAAYHLPIPGDFVFPLQNAEWFFTRTTHLSNPNLEYFQLPVTAAGDTSRAEKEFNREINLSQTQRRVGVRIKMKLKITLCSPKCK